MSVVRNVRDLRKVTLGDLSSVLYRSLGQKPPVVVNGDGNYLYTNDGRQILDATGGAAVACIGHNNARVKAAIAKELDSVCYCYTQFFTTPPAEKLSKFLTDSTHGQLSRAFIVSSGSEAIEAALKMARQYFMELPQPQPERVRFIARKQSYHGNTLGALAAGSHVARKAIYTDMLSSNVSHVSPCYPYRDMKESENEEEYVTRLAAELDAEFQRVGPNTVCAFIAETVSGGTLGCVPPVPGYFKAMKAVCDKYNALLLMDEVMSGIGRTGSLHAWEQEGVVPDIQSVAKGLGGGYAPIGALLLNKRVVGVLDSGTKVFAHSQTYQGHPLACATAYEVQSIIKEQNLVANVKELGPYLGELLETELSDHPNVGNIRGRGFFWGLEFVEDKTTKKPFPAAKQVAWKMHATGILPEHSISLMPGNGTADGKDGDHIIIAPSYISTRSDLEEIVKRTKEVVNHVLG
ncbi:PLP-dependent transferase [Xylona heveae TC161]|uniref:PLP-dependent transferase n=1 Tax=Xylona heveae (strain CBS 132557 / TC161) TaxID=1328760 RepID=A0A165FEF3_XYLHT|nr:PLP-dependent transferase [Xylona heveae TC161]KZF20886.1 PLP-dependent transferase [Xylona heveae TC161]